MRPLFPVRTRVWSLLTLGAVLGSSTIEANEIYKRGEMLVAKTPAYELYLSNSRRGRCREYNFQGEGITHWMWGVAFFEQDERLPLGDDFRAFFESVVWPRFSERAVEECGREQPNLTQIKIRFFFEGYERSTFDPTVATGEASRSARGEPWRFHTEGMATMAEVRSVEDKEAAREQAAETNDPFGDALEWVEASRDPESSHPPGLDGSDILLASDWLKVYSGTGGPSGELCVASPKHEGDYFLNLTLRFAHDAEVPVSNRQEYVDFFARSIFAPLQDLCPKASIVSLLHYMDEESHPRYIEEPVINRITLERYQTGKWQMAEPNSSEPIYRSAAHIAETRSADVASRDFEAIRAARGAHLRRIADALDRGDLFGGMGQLLAPRLDRQDALEEASLEDSGVFFDGDPYDHLRETGLILCNRSGTAMRLASAIQFVPRTAELEGAPPREMIVNGWGELDVDQCKKVRTGGAGSVFLRLESARSDGSFRTTLYETDGEYEGYSLAELNDSDREFRLLKTKVRFCVRYPSSFQFRAEGSEGVTENCDPGAFLLSFPHFIQYPVRTEQTLELR